jgi:hypothetical protein
MTVVDIYIYCIYTYLESPAVIDDCVAQNVTILEVFQQDLWQSMAHFWLARIMNEVFWSSLWKLREWLNALQNILYSINLYLLL